MPLQPPTEDAPAGFLAECPEWVIRTTDEVWNTDDKTNVNATLEKYFHPEFSSHGSFGTMYSGIPALKEAVASTMSAFPDLEIHISDVYCIGNDVGGYKTVRGTGPGWYSLRFVKGRPSDPLPFPSTLRLCPISSSVRTSALPRMALRRGCT